MRRLLALACAPWILGAAPGPDPVAYALRPVLEAGELTRLAVELRFQGDDDGVTEVRLPDRFNGEEALHRHLSDFSVTGAAMARPSPGLLRLTHARGAQLRLRYEVRNGRGPRSVIDYRPDLDPAGFTGLGEALFAWPVGRLSGPASVKVGPFPAGWRWASDLEQADTVGEILESATTAGEAVRVVTPSGMNGDLRVALRGRFAFSDAAFADGLARVLLAQRAVYGQPSGPFLAVVQGLPEDPARYTRDGVGRGDGAAYFISSHEGFEAAARVIAHEPVHAWLPRRVGGLPRGAAEPGGYWFSEGFADFVALRSLVRAEVYTLEAYARRLAGRLDLGGPLGDPMITNAELVAAYGRRPDLFQVPYHRGLALALLWDSRLREATAGRRGVDDVLAAMRVRATANPDGPTADQLFPVIYRELGGPDPSTDVRRHVIDGQPVIWPETLYDGCLLLGPDPNAVFKGRADGSGLGPRRFQLRPGLAEAEKERCRRLLVGG